MTDSILLARRGPVATITLHRPAQHLTADQCQRAVAHLPHSRLPRAGPPVVDPLLPDGRVGPGSRQSSRLPARPGDGTAPRDSSFRQSSRPRAKDRLGNRPITTPMDLTPTLQGCVMAVSDQPTLLTRIGNLFRRSTRTQDESLPRDNDNGHATDVFDITNLAAPVITDSIQVNARTPFHRHNRMVASGTASQIREQNAIYRPVQLLTWRLSP